MYEEKQKRFVVNWGSLIVKLAVLLIVFIIVLIIIALVNKNTTTTNTLIAESFNTNLEAMNEAALEYFSVDENLPVIVNDSVTLTLEDLVESKMVVDFSEDGESCSYADSYIQAKRENREDFTITTKLVCGETEDYIVSTITNSSLDDETETETDTDSDSEVLADDTIDTDNEADTDETDTITDVDTTEDDDNLDKDGNVIASVTDTTSSNTSSSTSSTTSTSSSTSSASSSSSTKSSSSTVVSAVTSVYLDYKKIYLYVGDAKTVTATVSVTGNHSKSVTWSSSNTNVATVRNGVITGVGAGTTTITATAGSKSASVTVVVVSKSSSTTSTSSSTSTVSNTTSSTSTSTSTTTTCKYGNTTYDSSTYIKSIDLTSNGCAVSLNNTYDTSTLIASDYSKIKDELSARGFSLMTNGYKVEATPIKNTSGTGLVGVQIQVTVYGINVNANYTIKTAQYIIKSDGSRVYSNNSLQL